MKKPAKFTENVKSKGTNDQRNWPTPRADANGTSVETRMTATGFKSRRRTRDDVWYGSNLREAVLMVEASWPTARTSDAEGGRIKTEFTGEGFRSFRASSYQWFGAKLRDAVEMDKPRNKRLNPDWVEQLMGLEVGTTQLNDAQQGDNHVDRLRMCGNGVVPQTAALAFATLFTEIMTEADND